MTEIEVAKKILEQGNCEHINCRMDTCPARGGCLARRLNGDCPTKYCGGLDSNGRKFFENFLKSKEARGMDKDEAIKRLDALDHEAAELRRIIEKGDKIEYDDKKLYVAINTGCPYILCGCKEKKYYRWHSFDGDIPTVMGWSDAMESGQEAIDYVSNYEIHVFTDPKEGIQFFYDQYMKAH